MIPESKSAQALGEVKRFLRSLAGLQALADQLEGQSSLEQMAQETAARLEALKADESQAQEKLLKAKSEVTLQTANAVGVKKAAEDAAAHVVQMAKLEAAQIVAKAKDEAKTAAAVTNSERALAEGSLESIRKEVGDLEVKATELRAEVANLKSEAAAILARFGGGK